ncbi:uncharacterized protein CANTADRAFT_5711, partial [Suhomyces tanzawaensis NRRL Y-17324]
MIFSRTAAISIALASTNFLTGVSANNKYLHDDYSDLTLDQPSTKYCSPRSILQVGQGTEFVSNHKRHIGADVGAQVAADVLGLVGVDVGAGVGVDVGKRHIGADVGAQVAADVLGLVGVDV